MKRLACAERTEKTVLRRAGGLCACAVLCLLGARAVEVSTVDELVAAMTAVNEGTSTDTKILLKPGYYDVSGCTMNSDGHLYIARAMQFEGVDDTSWRTTASSNTAVVIDAKGGNAIFRFDVSAAQQIGWKTSFRNITFQNGKGKSFGGVVSSTYSGPGHTVSNCVFRGNEAEQGGALMLCAVYDCFFTNNVAGEGGAVCAASDMHDSLFIDNRAKSNGGVARNGGRMKRCVFIGNRALRGSCAFGLVEASDSICRGNVASGSGGSTFGGGCFRPQNATETCEVRGCRFEANVSETEGPSCAFGMALVTNCVFVGNVAQQGGGVYKCAAVADSLFVSNTAGYGGGAYGCTNLTRCTFQDCAARIEGGAAYESSLFDCLVTNCTVLATWNIAGAGASSTNCVAQRTTFVDCQNATNVNERWATGKLRLTDCTFVRCGAARNLSAVRCTFTGAATDSYILHEGVATNCLMTGCSAKYLLGWVKELVNCTMVSNNIGTTGQFCADKIRAVNCIFRDNYHNGGHFDIAGYGTWTFENCLYKTDPGWKNYTLVVTDCVTNGVNPFLAPTHRDYDPAHPYAIGRRSPARNAGQTIDWPAGFTDLAGRPRVFDDRADSPRVDIGAYECCLPRRGACLVVR